MNLIKKYLAYLRIILRLSQSRAVMYRFDYALRIIRALTEAAIAYLMVSVYFMYSPSLAGWTYLETLLIYGIVQMVGSLVQIFFGSIQFIFNDIKTGRLDRLLTLPMHSLFLASTTNSYVTYIFRFLIGAAIFFNAATQLSLEPSLTQILVYLLSLTSSLVIYYCFFALASITAFWTFNGDLWFLMDTLSSTLRYPVDIFSTPVRILFHLIPLAFVGTIPAKVLLNSNYTIGLVSPLVAFVMFLILKTTWNIGLKQYEGAST